MLLSLGRGQEQLLLAVLEGLVDRVEALCLRRTVGPAGISQDLAGSSQDLVREEQPVNGAALGDAAEDEHDSRGRQRAAQAEEARAGCGGVQTADHREVEDDETRRYRWRRRCHRGAALLAHPLAAVAAAAVHVSATLKPLGEISLVLVGASGGRGGRGHVYTRGSLGGTSLVGARGRQGIRWGAERHVAEDVVGDLHGRSEEDVAAAAQRHDRGPQLVEHRGELGRAHHVGAQRDALDHGDARIVEDEVQHGDEHAARHADLEPAEIDQQEGAPDDHVLGRVDFRA
eukprot:scaffold120351_cov57-Phaeocystis_antarctica.AAC.1